MRIEGRSHDEADRGDGTYAVKPHPLAAEAIDTDRNPLDGRGVLWRRRGGFRAGGYVWSDLRALRGRSDTWALGCRTEDRRPARAPSSWRRPGRDFDALLAIPHAIRRHEFVTLGAANDVPDGGMAR